MNEKRLELEQAEQSAREEFTNPRVFRSHCIMAIVGWVLLYVCVAQFTQIYYRVPRMWFCHIFYGWLGPKFSDRLPLKRKTSGFLGNYLLSIVGWWLTLDVRFVKPSSGQRALAALALAVIETVTCFSTAMIVAGSLSKEEFARLGETGATAADHVKGKVVKRTFRQKERDHMHLGFNWMLDHVCQRYFPSIAVDVAGMLVKTGLCTPDGTYAARVWVLRERGFSNEDITRTILDDLAEGRYHL